MRRKMPPRWRTRTRWPREAVARRRVAPGFYQNRARRWPRPVSTSKSKSPRCRLRPGGNGADKCIARGTVIGARWRGQVSMAPRRNGRGLWGYAPACCGRLHESVPSSTLAVQINHITKDGPRTRRPATPMELPRHASSTLPPPATRGVLALSLRVGLAHVRAQAGVAVTRGAESATSPFGTGRPLRPCLVVNPGGGAAAPGFMAATLQRKQFPLRCAHSSRDKFFSLPGSPLRFDRKRCGQPIPAGRITTRTRWARPCSTRKEKHHG